MTLVCRCESSGAKGVCVFVAGGVVLCGSISVAFARLM